MNVRLFFLLPALALAAQPCEGEHPVLASFGSADGSTANALTIHFLNTHGQGTFTRPPGP